jgi:hypothetical protein
MFRAVKVATKSGGTIEPIHGIFKSAMRSPQLWRHNVGIVEIGKR